MKTKSTYTAPRLVSHGSVEKLTKASSIRMRRLDAAFAIGVDFDDLTFT